MKGVQLTKLVQELGLHNLTPEIDLSEIVIKTAEINRPALQLTGYLEHFANERVQIIGYVEYTYLMQLSDEERAFKYERFISSKIPCVIFSTMTRPSQDMIDLSDHTVKNNLLKFQISDHAKCHWRSNRNICGGFLKHIVCFISHCNDRVSLGRDHIFLDISFVSEKRIDFYGTASQIYSICFLK